jgi:selenocysteine lyase/cysteine desulfurase
MRFMGATFDPSSLYRFNAIQRMLKSEGLTTAIISAHVMRLQEQLIGSIEGTALGRAERLNRPGDARFIALRSPDSQRWYGELKARNCITDVRGDVLRIGLGIYHDEADIDAFAVLAQDLA